MGRVIGRLALLPLMLLLAGCGVVEHELDLSRLNDLKYTHESEAGSTETLQLPTNSSDFMNLVDWLDRNRSGWKPLQATLLPGGLSIYGDGFDLRVVHETAILSYFDGSGERQQLHKKIPNKIFAFLMDQ